MQGVCVCRGGCRVGVGCGGYVCAKRVFDWMLFNGFLSLVDMDVSEIDRLISNFC